MMRRPVSDVQRGVSLIETGLVLVVMGVMLSAIMAGHNQSGGRTPAADAAAQDAVVAAVFAFAIRNNRLPCPDVDGDDLEDYDSNTGMCTASDLHSGGVPFKSLGLTYSSGVANTVGTKLVYGVYRAGADPQADLAQAVPRAVVGAGGSGAPDYTGLDALRQAVRNAAARPASNGEVYVTGDDAGAGAADCNNIVANAAFVVAYAGPTNADRTGGDFDGAHLPQGWSAAAPHWNAVRTNTCFVGPGKQATAMYDDVVRAVSFPELLGALSQ